MRAPTGAGHNGLANTGRRPGGNALALNRSPVLGGGSSTTTGSGNSNGIGPRGSVGPRFYGWGNGNVASGRAGYGYRGYGFSGWGRGYGGLGYGYGGWGYGGWGNGYGSGYGNGGYGMGNGQYVWVFIPALGWVYVPVRLLFLLGLQ
jgi:hypothetical protein